MDEDHDPFNSPEAAHPRARELMGEGFFWDCVDEDAPFGSDEGHDAYYAYRGWRQNHPGENLTACLAWIMQGEDLADYNDELCSDEAVARDRKNPGQGFLADQYDVFTLDTTIIATALGQLLDEGRIDAEAKPFVRVAIRRQLHPEVVTSHHRKEVLLAVERVVERA